NKMKSPKALLGGRTKLLKLFTKVIAEDSKNKTVSRRQLSALSPTKFQFSNAIE
ncbi:5631_t:CDS:1, partial [Acaulospora morrowiae]